MPTNSYSVGLVNPTNGSATMIGVGTEWAALNADGTPNVRKGDTFHLQGTPAQAYKVKSVESDTSLTLERNYQEATDTGLAYRVLRGTQGTPGDDTGDREASGPAGADAQVSLGATTVANPDQPPAVDEGGTPGNREFSFTLPRAAAVSVGTVAGVGPGSPPTVTDSGTDGDVVLNFELQQGDQGIQGIQGQPGESGLPLDTTIRTADFTMLVGFRYGIDTNGGPVTASLPAAPSPGDRCGFVDVGYVSGAQAITVDANGSNIAGASSNVVCNVSRIALVFQYVDVAIGWVLEETAVGGITGPAATVEVGTVTTGAAGTDVIITNSGADTAAILDFTIPRGDQGIQGIPGAGEAIINPTVRTANFGCAPNQQNLVDTSGGPIIAVLPASPVKDVVCTFYDYGHSWDVSALTIARNGNNIGGQAEDIIIDVANINPKFKYADATEGWIVVEAN